MSNPGVRHDSVEVAEIKLEDDNVDPISLVPDAGALAKAQKTASALLAIVGVTRVVCVDDNFEGGLVDLVEACLQLPEGVADISGITGVNFEAPIEIWRIELGTAWNDLSQSQQRIALSDARDKAGILDSGEHLNAGALGSFFDIEIDFVPMGPAEWIQRSAEIIASSKDAPTLVLFDYELGDGFDGLKLVVDLYSSDAENVVWAGLFTHTVSIEQEGPKWDEFAKEPGVAPERFILLSKAHMGPQASTFPQALKVALMTRPSSELRKSVGDSITNQVGHALDELGLMSPAEFERIVFGLSLEEGMWEVDMLMRLFDAFLRSGVRTAIHGMDSVRDATNVLRRLSEIETEDSSGTEHARRIYRSEIYEEAEFLNQIHAPIELGDIFSTKNGKLFVLVAQPCDLMVRSNGKRAPEIDSVTLLRVVDEDPNGDSQSSEQVSLSRARPTFELPAFFPESGGSAWAQLDRAVLVPIETVDCCVFDPSGRSVVPTVETLPEWMNLSWKKRHAILAQELGILTQAVVDATTKDAKRVRVKELFGKRRLEGVSFTIDGDVVQFDLQRTARLRSQYSRALLTRFAVHFSRDAFEPSII
jgi:hypothetical protein